MTERFHKKSKTAIALVVVLVMMILPAAAFADDLPDLHAGVAAVMMTGADQDISLMSNLGAGAHAAIAGSDNEDVTAEIITDTEDAADDLGLVPIETDVEVPAEIAEQEPAEEIVMANVENAVNVRAEPSEDAEVVGKLFANCGGQILERRDGWTKLKSGELEGWTKDEFLIFGEQAQEASEEAGTLTATVNADGLFIRKDDNEEAGVIDMIGNGKELTAVEELGDWVSVKYDGEIGYVSSEYVDVELSIPTGKTVEQIKAEEKAKEEAEAAKKAAKEKGKGKGSKKSETTDRGAVAGAASEVNLLAALIQCEAGRECYEGQLAVGAVVMNRVRSGAYPGSISAVITAPAQFPPATNGRVAAVLAAGPSASCIQAAQAAISGQSNVGGATHFGTSGGGIQIGNHCFW